ncbi:hypothetical protein, partial [Lysobacter olei]
ANFLVLMILGAKHVEDPFIIFGQISTTLYFSYFIIITPLFSILDNILFDIGTKKNNEIVTKYNNIVLKKEILFQE